MRRVLKYFGWGLLTAIVLLVGPIISTELFCHGKVDGPAYQPLINNKAEQRPSANSYMTYPEWHIVYAYEGLAETLDRGDEYQFGYLHSVIGFWRAECRILQAADQHGGADFATRSTSYVIGPSFGLELFFKALYEKTLGAGFAILRGHEKAPQDIAAREMAHDYATFLNQAPWYEYDFQKAIIALWDAPVTQPIRGWERRLALTGEWKAKILYAQGIKSLVGATTGDADLTIFSVIQGLTKQQLMEIQGVSVKQELGPGLLIETPRYAAFNAILIEIAKRGGEIIEIAGNDNIMITTLHGRGANGRYGENAKVLATLERQGFGEERDLVEVKLAGLSGLIRQLPSGEARLEHIYDY
jgi:hypothetical protein